MSDFLQLVGLALLIAILIRQRTTNRKADKLMASQQDAAAQLTAINDKLTKVGGETSALLDEVQKLKDAAATAGQVSPELQAAIDAVSAQADKVDALVPDAPQT